jgi:hypothetical protein
MHSILILINTFAHCAEIAWQQSYCCGAGQSFPQNWTGTSCWSPRSLPGVNDRAFFQLNKKCIVRLKTADSVNIGELYDANMDGKDMQVIGPVVGSKNNFSVGVFTITSTSAFTIQGLNVVFRGSSVLNGRLNLIDCRATGLGSIAINEVRSSPFDLEFHVPEVTVLFVGMPMMQSKALISSSRIQIFGGMEVDVEKSELRGAVLELSIA